MTVLLVVGVDQLTKAWVLRHAFALAEHPRGVISSTVQVTAPTSNQGPVAALFVHLPVAAQAAATIVAGAGLLALAIRTHARAWRGPAAGLALGGALSNLLDRVSHGAVTDFLVLGPVRYTNIADIVTLVGVVGLLVIAATDAGRPDRPDPSAESTD